MAITANKCIGTCPLSPRIIRRAVQRWSGLRLNTFARRPDIGASARGMVALVLQALLLG